MNADEDGEIPEPSENVLERFEQNQYSVVCDE